MAEAKRISLVHHFPAQPVPMDGDPEASRRVFLILIDNAIKYTATYGRIEVDLRRATETSVTVQDSGIGISPRYVAGVIFLVFGLNGFLNFIPLPPPGGIAGQFMGALYASH